MPIRNCVITHDVMSRPALFPEGVSVFHVSRDDGDHYYLSLLSSEDVFSVGLAPETIIGEVDSPVSITPGRFRRNSAFNAILHEVIARVAPTIQEFIQEARRLEDGYVYVIDRRTPDSEGAVPPEDILGAFQVSRGSVIATSYQKNETHHLVTDRGMFRLHPAIHAELLKQLRTYSTKQTRA